MNTSASSSSSLNEIQASNAKKSPDGQVTLAEDHLKSGKNPFNPRKVRCYYLLDLNCILLHS